MTKSEAIEICEQWFAYNDRQREKTRRIQELATLARTGPEGAAEAQKQLRQIDRHPTVYDGGRLEPAVKFLLKAIRSTGPT